MSPTPTLQLLLRDRSRLCFETRLHGKPWCQTCDSHQISPSGSRGFPLQIHDLVKTPVLGQSETSQVPFPAIRSDLSVRICVFKWIFQKWRFDGIHDRNEMGPECQSSCHTRCRRTTHLLFYSSHQAWSILCGILDTWAFLLFESALQCRYIRMEHVRLTNFS